MTTSIIVDIGIDICLNCPYPDECIGTDTKLCPLIKDEVARVKQAEKDAQERRDQEMLESIQDAIANTAGLTMPELREKLGYEYDAMDRLVRHKKLRVKRIRKKGKHTKVLIVGLTD